jgi:hypothetical protein
MKQMFSIAFALALSGALLTGCDRNEGNRAASGGTSGSTSASGSASGSAGAGGTAGQSTEQQKRNPSPSTPGGGSGGTPKQK